MTANKSLLRKSHFLGTKIRNLRKRNNLTMEDLSTRCIRAHQEHHSLELDRFIGGRMDKLNLESDERALMGDYEAGEFKSGMVKEPD